ncbi:hypothetical protein UMM65_12025 [Aureibaculum sp. 2210JD6-5]|uniref:hypothetical protein n=1 Tax=Aureibaculum sp. 2210JD6-5 TaxID=3103957 RepID=UPI002AAD9347|nr:hypothetical protein [Aureibaculum sp. 2210JD6-5]MDY7395976.1 hypothetical protein [Aureibaculum sp. 2210JD6-5]
MVEDINYVFLALLISLQYLGFEPNFYQFSVDYTEIDGIQQPGVVANLIPLEDSENEWSISSGNNKIDLKVTDDKIADLRNGKWHFTDFKEIDFNRFKKEKDTVFDMKKKALIAVSKHNDTLKFKMLENSAYKSIKIYTNK